MKNRLLAVAAIFAISVSCSQADDDVFLDVSRPDVVAFIDEMVTRPDRAAAMGRAGRERAVAEFSWDSIAEQTMEVYRSVLSSPR